ncbi:copper amine oxidase N-terminal domain-containing protein [Ructibacterium gallinarum]|uniref:Copper amine oxidase N-terminal domain-containing protein n=1 Tax=Ructibacterium gallinarum TaxID=2779355 RepID=A0A9D5LZY2_9FIRM|nr:copper amine oxidase N-terminal domain-containing protein [Ructibacterium gallinarum]MBE5040087.1 copper amine oxidase N-terminal domain-containing protein [Ructibacterium gallinarum]
MKKIFCKITENCLMILLALSILYVSAWADNPVPTNITIWLNGTQIQSDVPPISENDRTLVPFRAIFEAMGAEVSWTEETQTASVTLGEITVETTIDTPTLKKNGIAIALDVPSRLINDRTMVPVRAISEALDALVDWNEDAQQVLITYPIPGLLTTEDSQLLAANRDQIRYEFEQSFLVTEMNQYSNDFSNIFTDNLVKTEKIFSGRWLLLCDQYILSIMDQSSENYAIDDLDTQVLLARIRQTQKEAGLLFEDLYSVSKEKCGGKDIILLTGKGPEKYLLGTIGAITQDTNGIFHLYLLAADMDNRYFFCESTGQARLNYGICQNSKEAFLDFLNKVQNNELPLQSSTPINN